VPEATPFTAVQLEQLLGPIALYPDALIALMLPAATVPTDVVLAARFIETSGDPASAAGRAWDESVKSLVHYPEVLKWMDENLEWTKQLGDAFRLQPVEVMDAIQRLRAQARAAGTLIDSPQQQVLVDREVISVVPAQPDVIYVPYYDPASVYYAPAPGYYDAYAGRTFVSFSAPFAVGSWLAFDCDWRRRTVWTAERHWTARREHDWRRPVFPGQAGYVDDPRRHPWRPSSPPPRASSVSYGRSDIARPAPIYTGPAQPTAPREDFSNRRNIPRDRPRLVDGRYVDPNYGRTFAPAPATPPSAPGVAPVPTTPATGNPPATTPSADRRGDPARGRNPSPDRTARPAPAATTTPAFSPVTPSPRPNPPVTGNLAGPPATTSAAAPAPQARPAPAVRAAPAPAPANPAPAPAEERKRTSRDNDPNRPAP
jgi:hypothetical protein